ncbi:hypothetical protein FMM05_14685, partial [Flavobacterium zepuense]
MKKYYFLFLLGLITVSVFGQGSTAPSMQPLCASINITFDNTTNSPPADPASAADSYGCLGSEPNPAWFYFQIGTSGTLSFDIAQYTNGGTPIDVDYIAWGPFAGPPPIYGPANLNNSTEVGCSYSGSAFESLTINNAQVGQYYVILLTNFSNQAGQISFEQSNTGAPGAGSTSCAILCPLTLGDDFILCPGTSVDIVALIDADLDEEDTTYSWTQDGETLPDADGPSLTVSEPGVYEVTINNPQCMEDTTDSVTVFAPDEMPINDPEDITICAVGASPYIFDLTVNTPVIQGNQDPELYPVTYYGSEEAANEGFPQIFPANAYPSPGDEVIWVRIEDYITGCYTTRSFTIFANPAPQAGTPGDLQACDAGNDGSETFDLTVQDEAVYNGQDPEQNLVSYHTTQIGATQNTSIIQTPETFTTGSTTVYVRLTNVNDVDCYSTSSFQIILTPEPVVVDIADVFICSDETYLLPEVAVGNYFTEANGEGDQLDPGTPISETQVIYIFAESNTTPNNCTDEESFTVTVNEKPEVDEPAEVFACESYILPALNVGQYFTVQNGTGSIIAPNTEITQDTTLYIYAETGDANTVICSDEYTFVINIDNRPVVSPAIPLEACDVLIEDNNAPNDFSAVFNLTTAGNQVTNNQPGYTVTYYTDEQGAIDGSNVGLISAAEAVAYNSESTPVTPVEEPLYIRVVATGNTTNCATVVPLQLIVHETPVIPVIEDYV